jgi:hypothetical protein
VCALLHPADGSVSPSGGHITIARLSSRKTLNK